MNSETNLNTILKEIRERCDNATEGPWSFNAALYMDARIWIESLGCGLYLKAIDQKLFGTMSDNSKFIAHTRTDIPMLLEMVEECISEYADKVCCCDIVKPKCLKCSSLERFEKIAEKYK